MVLKKFLWIYCFLFLSFSGNSAIELNIDNLTVEDSNLVAQVTSSDNSKQKRRKRRKRRVRKRRKAPRKYFKFSAYSDNIDKAKMSKVLNAYLDEDYEEAIEHATKLLKHKRLRRASNYYIALSLAKIGYFAASVHHFGEVIKMGVGQNASARRYYQQAVNSVLKISDEIKDDSLIPHLLKNVSLKDIGVRQQNKFYYNLGKYFYFTGQYSKTLGALRKVGKSDEYSRAQYIMGVVYAINKRYKKALDIFRLITKLPKDLIYAEAVRDKANLALARLFYGFAQYGVSQHFYDKINDDSIVWMTAVFESSWAYYMEEKFNKVLGKLEAINSPFFDDKFIPDFFVLRLVVLLKMCRIDELKPFIVKFNKSYTGLVKPIADYSRKYKGDSNKIFETLDNYFQNKNNFYGLPDKLVSHIAMEDSVYSTYYKIYNIMLEVDLIKQKSKSSRIPVFMRETSKRLEYYAETLKKKIASLVLKRIRYYYMSLGEHIDRARLVRLEFMDGEKTMMEKAMVLYGSPEKRKRKVSDKYVSVPSDSIYWPFQEEYWLDELGYHEFRLDNACEQE